MDAQGVGSFITYPDVDGIVLFPDKTVLAGKVVSEVDASVGS